jgi:hypothetical protein
MLLSVRLSSFKILNLPSHNLPCIHKSRSASLISLRPLNPPTLGDFEFHEFSRIALLKPPTPHSPLPTPYSPLPTPHSPLSEYDMKA